METATVKTRLVIYDFDGTVANVPEKPNNWNGKDWWGHSDSLSEPHFNSNHVNYEVVNSFQKDRSDPNTDVILLTGRRGVVAHKVRDVLRQHKLYGKRVIPDSNKNAINTHVNNLNNGKDISHPEEENGHEEYYSGDHSTEADYPLTPRGKADGSTSVFKAYIVNKKVTPQTEIVEFWDDREDHIPLWTSLARDLLDKYGVGRAGNLQKVIYHKVNPSENPAEEAGVKTITWYAKGY